MPRKGTWSSSTTAEPVLNARSDSSRTALMAPPSAVPSSSDRASTIGTLGSLTTDGRLASLMDRAPRKDTLLSRASSCCWRAVPSSSLRASSIRRSSSRFLKMESSTLVLLRPILGESVSRRAICWFNAFAFWASSRALFSWLAILNFDWFSMYSRTKPFAIVAAKAGSLDV